MAALQPGTAALGSRLNGGLLAVDHGFFATVAQAERQDAGTGVQVDVLTNGPEMPERAMGTACYETLLDAWPTKRNGIDATHAIRNLEGPNGGVPVLAMSANLTRTDIALGPEGGMRGDVPKPLKRGEMKLALADVLTERDSR